MLSIARLAVEQSNYYERQVAEGADDYYSGKGEAPGRWLGRGANLLGLGGVVQDGELALMMSGQHPITKEMVRSRAVSKVAAFDLTFSAPKSISVLYALSPPALQSMLVECHERSVDAAIGYLEDTAVYIRRGKGGYIKEQADGLVIAAFRHRLSRALDPQLHTHAVAANMARGSDGRWTALDRQLYPAAQTAGYLYESHLRSLVREELGLTWGAVRKGIAELEAVPQEVRTEFSQRRLAMQREAEKSGLPLTSKRAAEVAALRTRDKKRYGKIEGWAEHIKARAAEHGLDQAAVAELLAEGQARVVSGVQEPDLDLAPLFEELAGAAGLTEKANTFSERDVLRALAAASQQGTVVDTLRGWAKRFARREDVLVTRRNEMTTTELVEVERQLVQSAVGRAGDGVAQLHEDVLEKALATSNRPLNEDQQRAIRAAAMSGHGVDVIEALAGTGKTYTASVLRHVYEANGYRVRGVAPTARAVRELAEEAGVPAVTLTRMTMFELDSLRDTGVLIYDEAGMGGTRESSQLLATAQAAGVKVIAIGDSGQLHSVPAGGWMHSVGEQIGALKLTEVIRQRDVNERRALALLHEGVPRGYMAWAMPEGRVQFGEEDSQLDRALREWEFRAKQFGLKDAVLIVRSNVLRESMNVQARQVASQNGWIGEDVEYGSTVLAVGDRVICRRNHKGYGVDNGTRGTVTALDSHVHIVTDAGAERRLPAGYVANHLEHAYVLTCHGMQGATVEWAAVVATPHELTREWSYTALSRARGATRLLVLDEGLEWLHHELQERNEIAPQEIVEQPSHKQMVERVVYYMRQRDSEDLAIDQLPLDVPAERQPRDPAPRVRSRTAGGPELAKIVAALGEERGQRLEVLIDQKRITLADLPAEDLQKTIADGQGAVSTLDKHAAGEVLGMERQHEQHLQRASDLADRARDLVAAADALGWGHRGDRERMREAAAVQLSHSERYQAEAAGVALQIDAVRRTGRHPDQWLEQHGEQAAVALAARWELEDRARTVEDERTRDSPTLER